MELRIVQKRANEKKNDFEEEKNNRVTEIVSSAILDTFRVHIILATSIFDTVFLVFHALRGLPHFQLQMLIISNYGDRYARTRPPSTCKYSALYERAVR